jgi:NADPH:quinone reductase-like Zn-dependent oxidoreductase
MAPRVMWAAMRCSSLTARGSTSSPRSKRKTMAGVQSLGADEVIDYRTERFEDKAGAVDAVIDLVGGEAQARSFAMLKPGGVLVSAVAPPNQDLARCHGVDARFFLVRVTTQRLDRIAAMIAAGELRPAVGAVLPLAAARDAHEMLEGIRPHPKGKIVLRISE